MWFGYTPEYTGIERPIQEGYERVLCMPWGGIKAVTLDIEGDGTDEIVFVWKQSRFYEVVKDKYDKYKRYATYEVYPYINACALEQWG